MTKSRPGVYKALGADGFELCQPVNEEDYERISVELTGTPRKSRWRPIPMELVRVDEGRALAASDAPWLGYGPLILRPRAVDALRPLLREYGELLPLTCVEADLVVYNPTRVLDALDEAASSIDRFGDGRTMLVRRHVFRREVVGDNDIFTLPRERAAPTFLSHRFVDLWNESGLTGLEFKQLWDAEHF